jgi:hypothetical protein
MRAEAARPLRRELSHDRAFAARVKRLGMVSVVALGLIWWLAVATTDVPPFVGIALAAGWVLMPVILFASLRMPLLRYALALPASLVGLGLLALVAGWLPATGLAASGWLLVTAGVMLGGLLGAWFWFRLIPVPVGLDDPFSPGRWTLIAMHVALIVIGLLLAATPLVQVRGIGQ